MPSFVLLNETYFYKCVPSKSEKLITLNSKIRLLSTTIVQHIKALQTEARARVVNSCYSATSYAIHLYNFLPVAFNL